MSYVGDKRCAFSYIVMFVLCEYCTSLQYCVRSLLSVNRFSCAEFAFWLTISIYLIVKKLGRPVYFITDLVYTVTVYIRCHIATAAAVATLRVYTYNNSRVVILTIMILYYFV